MMVTMVMMQMMQMMQMTTDFCDCMLFILGLFVFFARMRTRNVPTEYFVNKCGKMFELIKTIPSRLKGSAHPYSTRAFKKYCSQPQKLQSSVE